jgi:NADH:ubiquinone reductase (H+-translocating)
MKKALPRVVIIGGGFGGLWATRALNKQPVEVILIDRANHHLFQPLLYQVATAGLSAPAIAAPLRHILRRQRNVTVLLGEVEAIDRAARSVRVNGEAIGYDHLIVASGATHAYFGHDDWAPHAPGLKTLGDALGIRERILNAFEQAERAHDDAERRAWLTFAIVGGGPTGVELAGTLAEIARHTLKNEFRRIDPTAARVLLLEAGPRVLSSFPESLSAKALSALEKLGVEVKLGQPVANIDGAGVRIGETTLNCRTVLWAAGVAASPLGKQLDVPLDRAGRVLIEPDLSIPGDPTVQVIGDLAALKRGDKWVPGVAPAAKQMGSHAARQILKRLRGQPTRAFVYRDFGNLATIGRMAAVADLGWIRFSGVFAWWFWLAAHVFFLIGFRNRLMVLTDWAWSYFSYQRSARIIAA